MIKVASFSLEHFYWRFLTKFMIFCEEIIYSDNYRYDSEVEESMIFVFYAHLVVALCQVVQGPAGSKR